MLGIGLDISLGFKETRQLLDSGWKNMKGAKVHNDLRVCSGLWSIKIKIKGV